MILSQYEGKKKKKYRSQDPTSGTINNQLDIQLKENKTKGTRDKSDSQRNYRLQNGKQDEIGRIKFSVSEFQLLRTTKPSTGNTPDVQSSLRTTSREGIMQDQDTTL